MRANNIWPVVLVYFLMIFSPTLSAKPAFAAQVLNTDLVVQGSSLVVQGSSCVGVGCEFSPSFGLDTFILKENNLRILFDDNSNIASFPNNDWRILINDINEGGENYFAVQDATAGATVFRIDAGAPGNSLYVSSSGNLGLGTATPYTDLHILSGDTPAIRLEQDNSIGWGTQTWDVGGNETNFFIRDSTNSNNLPFRIRPGAPTNSIYIEANGNVGLGTENPEAQLHTTGPVRFDALSSCPGGIGTNEFGDLSCLPAPLVQQAGAGQPITVGAAMDGTVINIAGTDGSRVLTGVASATAANDAINLGQLQSSGQSVASILGGGSQVNPDGTLSAPSYTVQGNTLTSIEGAFAEIDGTVTSNSTNIAILQGDMSSAQSASTGNTDNIASLQTDMTAAQTSISGNSYNLATLNSRATTNETEITSMQAHGEGLSWTDDGTPTAANATGVGSTALGNGASARTRDTAIGYMTTVTADGSTAIGANSTITAVNSVAIGADAVVNEVGGTAVGQNASVSAGATGSVAVGQDSVADEANTVSVGSAINQRRVTNVANGVNANDAVTVRQLQNFSASSSADIGRLDKRIDDLRNDSFSGIAAIAAMTAIPAPTQGKRNSLGIGYGNYKGENAVAFGFKSDLSESIRITTAVSHSRHDVAASAGVGWSW